MRELTKFPIQIYPHQFSTHVYTKIETEIAVDHLRMWRLYVFNKRGVVLECSMTNIAHVRFIVYMLLYVCVEFCTVVEREVALLTFVAYTHVLNDFTCTSSLTCLPTLLVLLDLKKYDELSLSKHGCCITILV